MKHTVRGLLLEPPVRVHEVLMLIQTVALDIEGPPDESFKELQHPCPEYNPQLKVSVLIPF